MLHDQMVDFIIRMNQLNVTVFSIIMNYVIQFHV